MTMRIETVWDGIEAIVLDAVGTLIEPWPSVAEVYTTAALRQGIELDRDVVRTRFRQSFRDDELGETFEALATDELTEFRRWRKIVTSVLPEVPEPERAFEELWNHFGRPDSWRAFPDVGPSLTSLTASGMPIAIASNFDGRLRAVVAGLPELAACQPTLVISSEVGYRKPHPAFYQAVSDHLGHRPESLLMVGDDPENDVVGARRAGLRGVWLDRRERPDESGGSDLIRVGNLASLVSLPGL
jgi:putative hydrolase of the HAD superfamily